MQAQRKLSAAKKSLQQQIEQTMDVKLPETPEKSNDSAQKDLKLYQDMMSKLEEKFENSKLYQVIKQNGLGQARLKFGGPNWDMYFWPTPSPVCDTVAFTVFRVATGS